VLARDLVWDGCANVRDLGGLPTEDGRETRRGAVVRADSVRQLSDDGWRELVAYGVRTIVDLRFHSELEADPPRELPVDLVHIPLLGDPDGLGEIDDLVLAISDPVARTRTTYLEFLERFPENFAQAVSTIARAPAGGVLVHCQGGKDRTGLVSALVLRLVGVPPDPIGADYAASVVNLAPLLDAWVAEAADEAERARRRAISAGPAEAMVEVLSEVERRYGSVADYLRFGGTTAADLEQVRGRLLD
jgi:protein-tyrosine phosphatase